MEAMYRNQKPGSGGGNPFDTKVHMARHRTGARGDATSFPLPWEDILTKPKHAETDAESHRAPDLPWVGNDLGDLVSIVIKTSDDNPRAMAKFVHQAFVRRDVVVKLIKRAKSRGHRAHRSVGMERVRAKARDLPENGVPPELVHIIPHDDSLDKLQVQKAATPVGGRGDLHRAAELLVQTRPNAVVLEKSSYDEADINAQCISALRTFAEQLHADI